MFARSHDLYGNTKLNNANHQLPFTTTSIDENRDSCLGTGLNGVLQRCQLTDSMTKNFVKLPVHEFEINKALLTIFSHPHY